MAGYSGTPLAKKLGIRHDSRICVKGSPFAYRALIEPVSRDVVISSRLRKDVDICHIFSRSAADLERRLHAALKSIRQDGMIWISWPKKASGVESDITEDVVRALALPLRLVDVKVCAIDETWSGLKLVIRKELRR
jgi:hypothetical protein